MVTSAPVDRDVAPEGNRRTIARDDSGLRLAQQLRNKFPNHRKAIARIFDWTDGEPLLTRQLCERAIAAPDAPPEGGESDWIDALVRSHLLDRWESPDGPTPLQTIRDRLCENGQHGIDLLEAYRRVLQCGSVVATRNSLYQELQLIGLLGLKTGRLRVRNRLYETAFDLAWVDRVLQRLRNRFDPSDADFRKTLAELERKLLVSQVNILSRADEANGGDGAAAELLYEALRDMAAKLGQLLSADRATIFLLNEDRTELWSVVAQNDKGDFLDIQVPVGEGIAGLVAKTCKPIHIPNNVYADPRSARVREADRRYQYRTENILAFPILGEDGSAIAVVQLLNKLQRPEDRPGLEAPRIHPRGFTRTDLERLAKCVVPVRQLLAACRSSYQATRKLRASAALAEATRSLDRINLDTKAILQRVMTAAKELLNADRSTLWLVDRDRGDLWTELPGKGEVRCPFGQGFVGQVAQSRRTMLIPYDLYDRPDATHAKHTDAQTRYRTCSLLCMPILSPDGELLGVTQLVNKRAPGDHPEYCKDDWPAVPDWFKASFDRNDCQAMQVFNERVGVILQFIRSHETLKQIAQLEPTEAVYKSLAVLGNLALDREASAPYSALHAMLAVTEDLLRRSLKVEHVAIFVLEPDRREFWTFVRDPHRSVPVEIRLSAERGMAGTIAKSQSICANNRVRRLNSRLLVRGLPPELREDLHHVLLLPVLDPQGQTMAIVRLANKLVSAGMTDHPSLRQRSPVGFTRKDASRIERSTEVLLPILQAFQRFYRDIRRIEAQRRAIDPLYRAISLVSQSSGNAEELIQRVMQGAKDLTHADRTTLWLIDRQQQELWTKIPQADGSLMETRVPIGAGFVGQVAKTGQPLNIPFDLYDAPGSEKAKETDRQTGYRTCSLLCMPVLGSDGEILGITQLVNKRRAGDERPYDAAEWQGCVPDFFQASFDEKDQRDMELFNNQVGVILPSILRDRSRNAAS